MTIRGTFAWPTWGWRGVDELNRVRRQMDSLFGDLTSRISREPSAGVFPLTNITEGNDNYYLRAELPGIKAEDLNITVTVDSLSISGERKIAPEKEEAKYHRREREAGKFSRIINLPGQIDTDKVEATCINGILTVVLAKAEATKPKQISVKAMT